MAKRRGKPAQQPEPKPTKYAGHQFRSRLEARWGVLLDAHFMVTDWKYEPKTYRLDNGWDYTPDFYYTLGDWRIWLEIKPERPSEDYIAFLTKFVPLLDCPLFVAAGSFYKTTPELSPVGQDGLHGWEPLDTFGCLPVNDDAIKAARRYRFDLPEQRPAFRSGNPRNLQRLIDHYTAKQRGQVDQNAPPPKFNTPKPLPPKKKPKRKRKR